MGLHKHVCSFCGKEYENYFIESKYCSKDCYKNYRKLNAKLKDHICPNCGKHFDAHDHNTIYCSKKCSGEAQRSRVECVCENCGKTFMRQKYRVEKHTRNFCSVECFANAAHWSKSDEKILLDNYGKLSYEEISSLLDRDIKPHSIHRKAKAMGLVEPVNIWTDDEISILINNYPIRPMNEMLEMLPNRSLFAILGQARKYNLKSYFYLNRVYTDEEIQYIKDNYIEKSYEEMSEHLGRTVLAIKLRMYAMDLHKPTEIAGYKNLCNYVRCRITPWKNRVREERDYTCEVTGSRSNIVVHHIRSFNILLEECIEVLDFPIYDDFSEYSQEQLDDFVNMFLELQEYYGEYACVTESVHKAFHNMYGYGNNTLEQWEEFICEYNKKIAA